MENLYILYLFRLEDVFFYFLHNKHNIDINQGKKLSFRQ